MSNTIQIKHGVEAPEASDLQEYELGYSDVKRSLYIKRKPNSDSDPGEVVLVSPGQLIQGDGEIFNCYKTFGSVSKNTADGGYSHAEGASNAANGDYSHAEGYKTETQGAGAHSEGRYTSAQGNASHAEGDKIEADLVYGTAFGPTANGRASHVEGAGTETTESAWAAHAEGLRTLASGLASHAEGVLTFSSGEGAHSEGNYFKASTGYKVASDAARKDKQIWISGELPDSFNGALISIGSQIFATAINEIDEGNTLVDINPPLYKNIKAQSPIYMVYATKASGAGSHAEGVGTKASGAGSHAEGVGTIASGLASHAEGRKTAAKYVASHAEGSYVISEGLDSHAEGSNTTARGSSSHAEGSGTVAEGGYSHAEGEESKSMGTASHAEGGSISRQSVGGSRHAPISYGRASHAEGTGTVAGMLKSDGTIDLNICASHAEGVGSQSTGTGAHAEGYETIAQGSYSHAEGHGAKARADSSHAEGIGTIAEIDAQHVQGKYNEQDPEGIAIAHKIGWGGSENSRKTIHFVDTNGNAWFLGKVYYGDTGPTEDNNGGNNPNLNGGTYRDNLYLLSQYHLENECLLNKLVFQKPGEGGHAYGTSDPNTAKKAGVEGQIYFQVVS